MKYLKEQRLSQWNLSTMIDALDAAAAAADGLEWVKTKGGERLSNTDLTKDPKFFNIKKKKTNGEIVLKGTTGCILPYGGVSYGDLYRWLIKLQDEAWSEWIPTTWNKIQKPAGRKRSGVPDVPDDVVEAADEGRRSRRRLHRHRRAIKDGIT